jgi:chromosomal replication initiator protein
MKQDAFPERAPLARGGLAIWKQIDRILLAKLGDGLHKSWIEPIRFVCEYEGRIILTAPTAFICDRVRREHLRTIQNLWSERDAAEREVVIVSFEDLDAPVRELLAEAEAREAAAGAPQPQHAGDNVRPLARGAESTRGPAPRLTFDNFVSGPANQVAAAAARGLAMGDAAAQLVFIYGAHGAGKTHLAQAAWELALKSNPAARVMFLSAEQFMSRFVSAARQGEMPAFKEAIRGADMLIVDDIHVIAREQRKGTQEEFFFTLNEFAMDGRRVMLTSALSPAELPELDSRVRAKLAGGVVCSIGDPDFEHRCQIVARKAKDLGGDGFNMSQTLIEYVAGAVRGNGRDLEGAMAQIHLYADRGRRAVTRELIDSAIAETLGALRPIPRVDTIIRVVAEDSGLTPDDLTSACRKRPLVKARHMAQYFARKLARKSFPDIARRFGNRDHATIMHGVNKIEALAAQDPTFARDLSVLEKRILEASARH